MKHKHRRHRPWLHRIPTQEVILGYHALKPVRRFLDHHSLWQFNRQSVAGGLAVGLFFSVAVPVAQMPLAAIMAVLFKVNLTVAVVGTLFSNPFTTPFILFAAFKIGAFLIGHDGPIPNVVTDVVPRQEEQIWWAGVLEWILHSMDWIHSAGLPLLAGLGVLSIILSCTGYLGVMIAWRLHAVLRWRNRATARQRER